LNKELKDINEQIISLENKEMENMQTINEYKEKENRFNQIMDEIDIKVKKLNNILNNDIESYEEHNYNQILNELKELNKIIKSIKNNDSENEENGENGLFIQNDSPKLIRLSSIEGINYMNSILECFIQTQNLTYYFFQQCNNIKNNNNEKYEFSKAYLEMIEELWKRNENTTFSPYNLRNIIFNKNKYLENSDSEKIPEFIDFILDQFHKELKVENYQNINENASFNINQIDNSHGFKNFYDKNLFEKSIISELFFGYKETSYFCLNCQNNILNYNYEIFKYIIFSLEDILDNYNSINKFEENYKISINDCFNIQYKKNSYKNEKNIHCLNCNTLSKCRYESQIYQTPEILIIILNRDKNSFINVE
jgi:ubiquitin C-terminal hydrolase